MRTYLMNQFDSKDFGNKAVVEKNAIAYNLYSYETLVASVNLESKGLEIYNMQSATTLRHIREFAQQHGYPKLSKKDMLPYFVERSK